MPAKSRNTTKEDPTTSTDKKFKYADKGIYQTLKSTENPQDF